MKKFWIYLILGIIALAIIFIAIFLSDTSIFQSITESGGLSSGGIGGGGGN